MSGPSDHGGFVSNDRSNMTRNPAANVQIRSTAGSVCNWTPWRENQLVNLVSVCDPSLGLGANNRKYHEPSAPRKITFYYHITECKNCVNWLSNFLLGVTKIPQVVEGVF